MTDRAVKVKGEQLSYLAHADSSERLIAGTTTGETPTGWNFKVKGTYLYWVDDDGAERRAEGSPTGGTGTPGVIKVKGYEIYYNGDDGDERFLHPGGLAIWLIGSLNNGYPYLSAIPPAS